MSKKWGSIHSSPLEGVFIEYTRGIRGVFTGYTYVSGMCRVCIAYVSGTRRKTQGAERLPGTRKEGKIFPTDGTNGHGNQKDLVSLRKRRKNRSTKGR